MARQIINIGSANDAMDGDTIRSGGAKLNANINELYDRSIVWEEGVSYAIGDLVRHPTERKLVACLTANSDATFTAAKWTDFNASGSGNTTTFQDSKRANTDGTDGDIDIIRDGNPLESLVFVRTAGVWTYEQQYKIPHLLTVKSAADIAAIQAELGAADVYRYRLVKDDGANLSGIYEIDTLLHDGPFIDGQAVTTPENQPPVLDFEIPDATVKITGSYGLNLLLHFSDPDGDTLTFTATGLPPGITLTGNSISGQVDATADTTVPYPVNITADDGNGGTVSENFIFTVTENVIEYCGVRNNDELNASSIAASGGELFMFEDATGATAYSERGYSTQIARVRIGFNPPIAGAVADTAVTGYPAGTVITVLQPTIARATVEPSLSAPCWPKLQRIRVTIANIATGHEVVTDAPFADVFNTAGVTGSGTALDPYVGPATSNGRVGIYGDVHEMEGSTITITGDAVVGSVLGSSTVREPVLSRSTDGGATFTHTLYRGSQTFNWTAANTQYEYAAYATGESNTGGQALNAQLTAAELEPRPEQPFWDVLLNRFVPMDIGDNNNLDHSGLTPATHSWEVELANLSSVDNQVSLSYIQTGQGGSRVAQWDGDSGEFIDKRNQRLADSQTYLPGTNIVWLYSQGINDAIDGLDSAIWEVRTRSVISRLLALTPTARILITLLPVDIPAGTQLTLQQEYNAAINQMAADFNAVMVIDTAGAAKQDNNHWSRAGFRDVIAPNIFNAMKVSV